jgi:phosphatidylserine decarboxylase
MYIHKEGHTIIIIALIILVGLCYLSGTFAPQLIAILTYVFTAVIAYLIIQFFRNPKRPVAGISPSTVICPADGKVVVIEEVEEPEYFKDKRIQISVFMSPLNVHSNKAAIPGEVSYTKYHEGKYLVAWHPKSSTENERSTIVIKQEKNEVLLRQIAGAVARRIKNYAKVGQELNHGEEFGFIKFGSRVDIFLPLGSEVLVKHDQIVRANITQIANLPS